MLIDQPTGQFGNVAQRDVAWFETTTGARRLSLDYRTGRIGKSRDSIRISIRKPRGPVVSCVDALIRILSSRISMAHGCDLGKLDVQTLGANQGELDESQVGRLIN